MATFKVIWAAKDPTFVPRNAERTTDGIYETEIGGDDVVTMAHAAWEVAIAAETPLGAELVDVVRLD